MTKLLMVAGEPSGDSHGAHLIKQLRMITPQLEVYGIGGQGMIQQGLRAYYTLESLQVHGLVEVIPHLPRLYQIIWNLRDSLDDEKPQAIVLIDYPAFNLKLAAYAKQRKIPVLFFSSPQIWAWRSGRIRTIQKVVDHMMVLFPFETAIYQKAQIPVTFVGNPLIEQTIDPKHIQHFKQQHLINDLSPIIALLPGSRTSEIQRHLPILLDTLEQFKQKNLLAHFILPIAGNLDPQSIQDAFSTSPYPIIFTRESFLETVYAADVVITASGTASLQTAVAEKPNVVIYKVSPLSFWIAKALAHTRWIGMANIISGRKIVEELLQEDCNGDKISQEVLKILNFSDYRNQMITDLQNVRSQLGTPGAYDRAAQTIRSFLA